MAGTMDEVQLQAEDDKTSCPQDVCAAHCKPVSGVRLWQTQITVRHLKYSEYGGPTVITHD